MRLFSVKSFVAVVLLFVVVVGGSFLTRRSLENKFQANIDTTVSATRTRLEQLARISPEEEARIQRERETLAAQQVSEDTVIEGITVEVRDNKKVITNIPEEYQITLPLNLVIARSIGSDWLEFHDKEFMCKGDPSCPPVVQIQVESSNPEQLSLDKWFKEREKEIGAPIYTPREKVTIGNGTAYRVNVSIPGKFTGFYYYWSKGQKIYSLRISKLDNERYFSFVKTFTLAL